MKIRGSTPFITGANGGIGKELVADALVRGARRVYAATRGDYTWDDSRVVPVHLDVTHPRDVVSAAVAAPDVDVLINNAGGGFAPSLLDSPEEAVREVFEINVFGPLAIARAFAPVLAKNGGGALVNVHSVLSWRARPGAYSPSKTALWGVTNSLRLEFAAQRTQVVGAHFGFVDTPMTAGVSGVSKADPRDIAKRILDGVEEGLDEVLADRTAVEAKAALSTATVTRP